MMIAKATNGRCTVMDTGETGRPVGEQKSSADADGRYLGIDVGAETLKVVEVRAVAGGDAVCGRRRLVEHGKDPGRALLGLLDEFDWETAAGAAVTGRLARLFRLPHVPVQQSMAAGLRHFLGDRAATLISIGSRGFSVLECRENGVQIMRGNSRCSQGTGNFLRQLVGRFSLSIEEAGERAAGVADPEPLSGRCPVILKTDMTHLANKGISRDRILAGLFDAVCDGVLNLVKPGRTPSPAVLSGGVTLSARVRARLREALAALGLDVAELGDGDARFLEALGCARLACGGHAAHPERAALVLPAERRKLVEFPALAESLSRVRRVEAPPRRPPAAGAALCLGLDIGSTGSKIAALDCDGDAAVWESYRATMGDPVGAAQALVKEFLDGPAGSCPVVCLGVTGSGREIVGSLVSSLFGGERVFILNEIAAHAAGACRYDERVDTIFEIGGQDAKYIRLDRGKVIDCAMNEACSAGTGSFIEEQGGKFEGVGGVTGMSAEAIAAPSGVSLGQHCSVFMAEVIDEAVAAGVARGSILAGLYDSVIRNYLNRVKGNRPVGRVVFCQGMPFTSDALAAAVGRQTGSKVIVPPSPGTVGAFGIALLALRDIPAGERRPMELERLLEARVEQRDTFVCRSTKGCGGKGNACRIDFITTFAEGRRSRFTWGGGCGLHDHGVRSRKLPDRTPDPFRKRAELAREAPPVEREAAGRRIAMTAEFMLSELLPFFTVFFSELGLRPEVIDDGAKELLKRGIQGAQVPFCAPMQLFHGAVAAMAERDVDFIFAPMIRRPEPSGDERNCVTCPIMQGAPDVIAGDLEPQLGGRLLAPVMDLGRDGTRSRGFRRACAGLAARVGARGAWHEAYERADAALRRFQCARRDAGGAALAFCREHGLPAVVVVGRSYTIHNRVLNSNVPELLREQGAVAIPLDCYPLDGETPTFGEIYWECGQRILRAAHDIRRRDGVYAVYCSNYSCGPDSFLLHFFAHATGGKPFAVIETDGHCGDSGTKTRIEAFLHCAASHDGRSAPPADLRRIRVRNCSFDDIGAERRKLLIPWMGPTAAAVAAAIRGAGVDAEALPVTGADELQAGRRYTSGKECLPMALTLGGLLERLEQEPDRDRKFALLMPKTCGPCRFGVYNLLSRMVLERLGFEDGIAIWSPDDSNYFEGLPRGLSALICAGAAAADLLYNMSCEVRPDEPSPGFAAGLYDKWSGRMIERIEKEGRAGLSSGRALSEVISGRAFGLPALLRRAAREFAAIRRETDRPVVLIAGEIYVRLNAFANGFLADELNARGLRVRVAPASEWLEYVDIIKYDEIERTLAEKLKTGMMARIISLCYRAAAGPMRLPARTTVEEALSASSNYLRSSLRGEAVLTVGTPLHEWRAGHIDGAIAAGPLECMPNKIAESHGMRAMAKEGLPFMAVSLNGEPVDPAVLDNFAFAAWARKNGNGRHSGI